MSLNTENRRYSPEVHTKSAVYRLEFDGKYIRAEFKRKLYVKYTRLDGTVEYPMLSERWLDFRSENSRYGFNRRNYGLPKVVVALWQSFAREVGIT